MSRSISRRSAVAGGLLLALLFPAATFAAADHYQVQFEDTFTDALSCGVVVENHLTVHGSGTIRPDGEEVVYGEHLRWTAVFSNPATGASLTSDTIQRFAYRLATPGFSLSGPAIRITVPGTGLIAIDTGRLDVEWDGTTIHVSAKSVEFFDDPQGQANEAAICEALGLGPS